MLFLDDSNFVGLLKIRDATVNANEGNQKGRRENDELHSYEQHALKVRSSHMQHVVHSGSSHLNARTKLRAICVVSNSNKELTAHWTQ